MDNDRTLLEKAAKAAGYKWRWYVAPVGQLFQIHDGFLWNYWNPRADDGDSLRLAVTLRLFHEDDFVFELLESTSKKKDPYAATRRAIVRAAAAIGESK